MIDPINLIKIEAIAGKSILNLDNIPEYDIEEYQIFDDKGFKKYMQDLEREVRGSFEYREMIKYLKNFSGMSYSAMYENINNLESSKIKIEIHHSPFTLYDICTIVMNKRLANDESLELEMVAKEIMMLHYKAMVGLLPLTQTEHELVHNGYLFVPSNIVRGNYRAFSNLYENYMTAEQLDVLDRIEEFTDIYNSNDYKAILHQNNIYINPGNAYTLPIFNDLKQVLSTRVQEIKDNAYMLPILDKNSVDTPK